MRAKVVCFAKRIGLNKAVRDKEHLASSLRKFGLTIQCARNDIAHIPSNKRESTMCVAGLSHLATSLAYVNT